MIQRHIFIIYFDIYNKHRYSSLEKKKKIKTVRNGGRNEKEKKRTQTLRKTDIRETRKTDALLKN
jgi:hypothetical protein